MLDSINGNEAIKIAVMGDGSPVNEFFWLVSMLNFANLIAANITIKKAVKEKVENGSSRFTIVRFGSFIFMSLNRIKLGAIPDVIKSAILSNCMPNTLSTFKILAKNPSKKSNATPVKIKYAAKSNWLLNVKIIDSVPQHKLDKVM